MYYSIKECWLVQYTERRALFLPLYFSVQIRKFCYLNKLALMSRPTLYLITFILSYFSFDFFFLNFLDVTFLFIILLHLKLNQ